VVKDLEEYKQLQAVANRLSALFGHREWKSHGDPLDELIATVLSQHTSDMNTERAFASLRRTFPHWQDVASAPTAAVTEAIRCGGLASVKAPRIQQILRTIKSDTGNYSLDFLRTMPLAEAKDWLIRLPGVGPKTAACVLLFSLGLPAMPVDTHVHRVSRRLGLIAKTTDAREAHMALDMLLGPDRDAIYALHLNLIQHGRLTCKARLPACGACPLSDLCPNARV
jgi:endonuclease-3